MAKVVDWSSGSKVIRDIPEIEIPEPTFTETDVRVEAARRLAKLVDKYTKEERETWPEQVSQSISVLSDPSAESPIVRLIADARGVAVEAMAGVILKKRDAYLEEVGKILSAQGRLCGMENVPSDYTKNYHWE